jgi:hypothetical protein
MNYPLGAANDPKAPWNEVDDYDIEDSILDAAPEMYEVLEDLDAILGTALHNGHHDLIERVKKVLKKARGLV